MILAGHAPYHDGDGHSPYFPHEKTTDDRLLCRSWNKTCPGLVGTITDGIFPEYGDVHFIYYLLVDMWYSNISTRCKIPHGNDLSTPENIIDRGLVGCIEEILFRGFIFQSLLADLQTVSAICISSLFYSLLHFFKVKLLVTPGFQPFIGFIVIYQSFKDIAVNFPAILPLIIGLFLLAWYSLMHIFEQSPCISLLESMLGGYFSLRRINYSLIMLE